MWIQVFDTILGSIFISPTRSLVDIYARCDVADIKPITVEATLRN
jgi:hypothetical protein